MRKHIRSLLRDVLMLVITVTISSSIGACAYILTKDPPNTDHTLELPEPLSIAKDSIEPQQPASASVLGLTPQLMEQNKPTTTHEAHLTREAMMYLDEGRARWGTLPEGTRVFAVEDARSGVWKVVYYAHQGENLKLYVEHDAVADGPGESMTEQVTACEKGISHGHVYTNTIGHGTNAIHVYAPEEHLIVKIQSEQGRENVSYVSKGRSIDIPAPAGRYRVSFLMGREATSCGAFEELLETKEDPEVLVLEEHMKVNYSLGYTSQYGVAQNRSTPQWAPWDEVKPSEPTREANPEEPSNSLEPTQSSEHQVQENNLSIEE